MSIRRRTWTNAKGVERMSWVVDYVDSQGKRRLKTFIKKKDADGFAATAKVEVRQGIHVADSASVTVEKAGELWVQASKDRGLERSTIAQRERHLKFHVNPFIGQTLLSKINVPAVRAFEDTLRREGRSPAMVKKVVGSLGSIFSEAQELALATVNPVRDRSAHRRGRDKAAEKRHKGRLKVGEDIPAPEEVKAVVGALTGRWRPLLLVAIFAGLRSSELRGLRWQDVDLDKRAIHVRQRADEFGDIGRPKSDAGERTIPVPPIVIAALKEWKLGYGRPVIGKDKDGKHIRQDARPSHLVFANGAGKVESHANIVNRGLIPAMLAAGVTFDTGKRDDGGRAVLAARYTGLHALRHFYASWCINRPQDGGLGLPLKVVQERLGHSSVTMTADVYGHLFPRGDDADEMAAAERALLN